MRIAVKYSMDDIQVAITKAILLPPTRRTEISRLAFVAEFPSYFFKESAIQVFIDASSIEYHLTDNDIQPLMAHPAYVVLLMHHREGCGNPAGAIWKECYYHMEGDGNRRAMNARMWLDKQFTSFGFKSRA